MTGTSTVLAVRTDLVTRFQRYLTDAGVSEVQVTRGNPVVGDVVPLRFVAIGTTQDGGAKRDIKRLPYDQNTSVDEGYTLEIVIWQQAPGDMSLEAQQACTDKVWEIAGVLDDGLRASQDEYTLRQTPGVANTRLVSWCSFVAFEDDEFYLENGRAAQITARLEVNARRI